MHSGRAAGADGQPDVLSAGLIKEQRGDWTKGVVLIDDPASDRARSRDAPIHDAPKPDALPSDGPRSRPVSA